MRAGLRAAILACCLVTAGCTGFLGGQNGAAAEPVTPAPVPADPPAAVVPGLTERGVADADALVRTHSELLANTSYTLRYQRRVRAANGTVRRRETTRLWTTAGYDAYRAIRTVRGEATADRRIRVRWADNRAVQWTTANGTRSRRIVADGSGIGGPPLPPRDALFFDPTFADRLRDVLTGANVTAVEPTGEEVMQLRSAVVYRIYADGTTDPSKFPRRPADRVSDVSVTATVTGGGLVQSYAVRCTVVRNGTEFQVTESLRYTGLGSTTVDEA